LAISSFDVFSSISNFSLRSLFISIILNFLKKDRAHREISDIALDYLKGTLIFDSVATFPNLLIWNENY
jgi:hypothetical protein